MGILESALLAAVMAAAGPADATVPLSVVSGRLMAAPVRLDDTGLSSSCSRAPM